MPRDVRWATRSEQMRNTRRSRFITAFGETRNLIEWANLKQISPQAIRGRLALGWSPERALSTPIPPKKNRVAALVRNRGYASVSEFLRMTGISPATFYKLESGKPLRPSTLARIEALLGKL